MCSESDHVSEMGVGKSILWRARIGYRPRVCIQIDYALSWFYMYMFSADRVLIMTVLIVFLYVLLDM